MIDTKLAVCDEHDMVIDPDTGCRGCAVDEQERVDGPPFEADPDFD